jgi:uncharacterized membrane protein
MRSFSDRIRHAISFEVIGLALVIPLGTLAFHMPMHDVGVVSLVSATLATAWNLVYNVFFDLGLRRITGTTAKGPLARICHAILFETGLLVLLLPFIAWYTGVSIWQAFVMDLSFAAFYVLYALGFNWSYDRLFPLAEWETRRADGRDRLAGRAAVAAADPANPHPARRPRGNAGPQVLRHIDKGSRAALNRLRSR